MISREKWGAKALTKYDQKISPSYRTGIVIHHSVTGEGKSQADVEKILRQIDDFHRGKGYGGIGYNVAVDYAGRIYEARGLDVMGAHTAKANGRNYGIVYLGNTDKHLTDAAVDAIKQVVDTMQARSKKKLTVKGHRDHSSTACPGAKLYAHVKAGAFNRPYPIKATVPKPVPVKPAEKPKPTAPKPPAAKPAGTITVLRGDSYWKIAARSLGLRNTPLNAGKIALESNRIQKLNGKSPLHPGMKVKV